MSKELDIQIGVFNKHPDVRIGVADHLKNIGIEIASRGKSPNTAEIEVHTAAEWNDRISYIPPANRIIVYSDKAVIDGTPVPGIKIADGSSYVVDLPFVGDEISEEFMQVLAEHANDKTMHITEEERKRWNDKLNYDLNEETLILNRD